MNSQVLFRMGASKYQQDAPGLYPFPTLPKGQFVLLSVKISICVKNGEHCFYPGEHLILSGNLLNYLLPVQIMKGTFEYS